MLELPDAEVPVVDEVLAVPAAFCAAVRSPNRFVVPRNAPRLDCGPVALADDVVELVEEEVAAGVVLAVVEPVEFEPVDEELDDVPEDELDDEEDPPPLPPLDRFPESRGAINPANCSAEIVPLRRID